MQIHPVSCRISMNKESVSQLQDFQWVKSYRTSKQLLFPLYIPWEGTVLTTNFKIIVTKARQIIQMVTMFWSFHH